MVKLYLSNKKLYQTFQIEQFLQLYQGDFITKLSVFCRLNAWKENNYGNGQRKMLMLLATVPLILIQLILLYFTCNQNDL